MVKAKKKKKRVKEKAAHNMFVKGGLNLLLMGGFIALFYQTLYILISMESQTNEISYQFFIQFFKDVGFLFLFVTLVLLCVFYLKEIEFFQKHAGSFLIGSTVLSFPAVIYQRFPDWSFLRYIRCFNFRRLVTSFYLTQPLLLLSH